MVIWSISNFCTMAIPQTQEYTQNHRAKLCMKFRMSPNGLLFSTEHLQSKSVSVYLALALKKSTFLVRRETRSSTTPSTSIGKRPTPLTPTDTDPRREMDIYEKTHAAELVSWPFVASYINKTCDGVRRTRGGGLASQLRRTSQPVGWGGKRTITRRRTTRTRASKTTRHTATPW